VYCRQKRHLGKGGLDGEKAEIKLSQRNLSVGHWWPMSVILVTQEAEIMRIEVQSQPGLVEWLKM
jgi:hypothetical protein